MTGRPVRASHVRARSTPTAWEVTAVLGSLTVAAWSLCAMLMKAVGAW